MDAIKITKTRLRAGVWEGVITGVSTPPALILCHNGEEVGPIAVTPNPDGTYHVRADVPAHLICEGLHSFVITTKAGAETLASFAIFAGEDLDDDLRAEVALLRAELDLLKRAFRQQWSET